MPHHHCCHHFWHFVLRKLLDPGTQFHSSWASFQVTCIHTMTVNSVIKTFLGEIRGAETKCECGKATLGLGKPIPGYQGYLGTRQLHSQQQ
jgi:hypothetical protein